jgi:hypothetical protein
MQEGDRLKLVDNIAFNTFYDNRVTFNFGYGSGSVRPEGDEFVRNQPPQDVIVANNLVFMRR